MQSLRPVRRVAELGSFGGRIMFKRGDIVEIAGQLAVVVGTFGDGGAPEEHIAVWFGDPKTKRGGPGGQTPEVWTIPEDLFERAKAPEVLH